MEVLIALVAALVVPGSAVAQDKFPSKPITIIVPFSAGGSTDLLARAVEKIWPKYSSQPKEVVEYLEAALKKEIGSNPFRKPHNAGSRPSARLFNILLNKWLRAMSFSSDPVCACG